MTPASGRSPGSDSVVRYLKEMGSVPGWFLEVDARIFAAINSLQLARGFRGDLLEIGVYYGKSAILLGYCARPDERLMVCDVFEEYEGLTQEGLAEHRTYHADLRRIGFERQYQRFHHDLPEIVAAPSAKLDRDRLAGRFRFIHVDGGHAYDVVREDIVTARRLLGQGGVGVFDDWSQPHCPGVALAVWEEHLRGEMTPLCLTGTKFYATWDSSGLRPEDLDGWAMTQPDIEVSPPDHLGRREVRRYVHKTADRPGRGPAASDASRSPVRRAMRQVMPPILGRWLGL